MILPTLPSYEDVVEAAPDAVAAALPPCRTLPVLSLVVSLLLNPVGCKSCIGMSGKSIFSLATTSGPAIKATKMISIKKYKVAKRMTLRFRNLDCLIE